MKTLRLLLPAAAAVFLSALSASATPFASCITNSGSTIYFDLNEAGGNVTVTYEDGSTNASFNGSTTGLNLPAGYQNFSLAGHTSYNISVRSIGSGVPHSTTTIARNTARGLAVNKNGASKYFGYVYSAIGAVGVVVQNADGTGGDGVIGDTLNVNGLNPGGFWGATTYSPNKLSIAPDDYVIVGDYSKNSGGVARVDPMFSQAQLLLAGQGQAGNHGSIESRPILTGTIGTDATLYAVDASFVAPYNQIFQYNFGTGSYDNGSLPWQNPADLIGTNINPANLVGYNDGPTAYGFYAGLSRSSNGWFYVTVQRQNLSNPNLQVYDTDGKTLLWSSFYKNGSATADYVVTGTPQLSETTSAPSDSEISPDERYIAMVHLDNHVTILSLTNDSRGGRLPNIYAGGTFAGPGTAGNARGLAWDAAGNLWMSSSGLGTVYQYSLGRTATAVTSGNINGPTGFTLNSPPEADLAAANPLLQVAAQTNPYGYPKTATNFFSRVGDVSAPLTVNFTVGGTAAPGTYVLSATNSVTFAAGQDTATVLITPVTDGIARPTTTVILTLVTNGTTYNLGFQKQSTTYIINTATPQVVVTPGAASMYNAYSNDYTSVVLTRWGDTNTAFTTGAVVFGGAAVNGTDYAPLTTTTASFVKGDLTKTVRVAKPLMNGQIPVHTANNAYVGNKTFTATVQSGTGYNTYSSNNVATLTIVDSAYPTATVLYSNPLTDPNDISNWNLTAAVGDTSASTDYNVDFGYDLTANNFLAGQNGLIPLPPSGANTALRMTTAKQYGNEAQAVNAYLTNQVFSGNYAVRFNMYIVQGQHITASDEGPLFGINHDGQETNWWFGAGTLTPGVNWSADGVWYWIDAWAGGFTSDYMEFTGITNAIPNTGWRRPATSTFSPFANVFKDPEDFTTVNSSSNAVAGLPANASPFVKTNVGNWADVQIMNSNNVVTLSINKQTIFTYNNTNTLFQQGNVMLGYETPAASALPSAGPDAAVYYSNLKVVAIASAAPGAPTITSTTVSGGNVVITFTSPNNTDTTSSFTVQSVAVVNGTFTDTPATITGGSGSFQATIPTSGATQFYRIHHN
jgi:hypothetical protein